MIELAGSRLDDAWHDLMSRPGWRAAWTWGGPALVMVVAILSRLVGLGHPHELVFDETYYVKDAFTLSQLGYEGSWPADANLAFNAGTPTGYLTAPSFVAHPPVGKWIIAAGLALFGAGDPFGWRVAVAICFDMAQPAHAMAAAEQRTDLYVGSALYTTGEERRCDLHFGARAMDHRMFAALANYAGTSGGLISCGGSGVWRPSGEVLGRAGGGEREELLVIELDRGELEAFRRAA